MRSFWGVLAGSLVLALLLQFTNCLFEAAGSVPDLEGCGFLAGGLPILGVLYPLLSSVIAFQFGRKAPAPAAYDRAWYGGLMGALGAFAYFGIGIGLAVLRGRQEAISSAALFWILAFVLLCYAGGGLGAACARFRRDGLAVQDSGS
jgi:hypothetical protein